jgi:uncharacterized membrane-anchored protein
MKSSANPAAFDATEALSKVPQVTLLFWIIKIFCTTLGETGGDAVTQALLPDVFHLSEGLSYGLGTLFFAVIFLAFVFLQIRARAFHPVIYWLTIIATTTVGTTMADLADRPGGLGYALGSSLLLALVLASLSLWYWTMGSISIKTVRTTRVELFYWVTIMFSQTLGTALGDWVADSEKIGYLGGIALFAGLLALVAALHFFTRISKPLLFWAAFILTRPLGAVVGDFLDKPLAQGGLNLSRFVASGILILLIAIMLWRFKQKPAEAEGH